jgi:hypothetical protein
MTPVSFITISVVLGLLLLGIAIGNTNRRAANRRETYYAGEAACTSVTIALNPGDPLQEKNNTCQAVCNSRGGYRSVSHGAVNAGTDMRAVQCQCCDPASQVTLGVQYPGSEPCLPNVTFGISNTDSRSMYVKGGCRGVFQWGDQTAVTCNSVNGQPAICPYFDDKLSLGNAEMIRKAKATLLKDGLALAAEAKERVRLQRLASSTTTIVAGIPVRVTLRVAAGDGFSGNTGMMAGSMYTPTQKATASSLQGTPLSLIGARIPITDGLIAYLDPGNNVCYNQSTKILVNLMGTKELIRPLGMSTYSDRAGGCIRLDNSSADRLANTAVLQLSMMADIMTVSVWYFQHSISKDASRYLLDVRTGGNGGWIYSDGTGSNWTPGKLYVNGSGERPIYWGGIEKTGVWRNVTVVANKPVTDDMTLFGRHSVTDALDVSFGVVLVYNRAITEYENRSNFQALRARYGIY